MCCSGPGHAGSGAGGADAHRVLWTARPFFRREEYANTAGWGGARFIRVVQENANNTAEDLNFRTGGNLSVDVQELTARLWRVVQWIDGH